MTRLLTASCGGHDRRRAPALAAEPRASLPDIEDEVMCPICGTLLELSEAPQAERERVFIRNLIAAGATKEEIKDALVAEYGEEVAGAARGRGLRPCRLLGADSGVRPGDRGTGDRRAALAADRGPAGGGRRPP